MTDERNHSVATLAVLVVVCVFALFIGLKAAFKPFPDSPLGSDVSGTCLFVDVRQGERIGAQDVLVSVFNASGCTSPSRRSEASACPALSSVPAWLTRMDRVSGWPAPSARVRAVMTCSSSGNAAA